MFPLIVYSIAASLVVVVLYHAALRYKVDRDEALGRAADLEAAERRLRVYVDRLEAERNEAEDLHVADVERLVADRDRWRSRAEALLSDASATLTRHYDRWSPVDAAAQDDAA